VITGLLGSWKMASGTHTGTLCGMIRVSSSSSMSVSVLNAFQRIVTRWQDEAIFTLKVGHKLDALEQVPLMRTPARMSNSDSSVHFPECPGRMSGIVLPRLDDL